MEDLRMLVAGDNGLNTYDIKPEIKNILTNIMREVDAIRGYILDPVDGDFVRDEIDHIEELCDKLRTLCGAADDEELDDDADDDADDEELDDDADDDAEEGEHY